MKVPSQLQPSAYIWKKSISTNKFTDNYTKNKIHILHHHAWHKSNIDKKWKKLNFTQNYSYASVFSNQVRIYGNALLTARSGLMNGSLRFCSRKLKSEFYSPYCLLWNVHSSTWPIVKGADKLLQRSISYSSWCIVYRLWRPSMQTLRLGCAPNHCWACCLVGFSDFKSWVPSHHNFSSDFEIISISPLYKTKPHNLINSTWSVPCLVIFYIKSVRTITIKNPVAAIKYLHKNWELLNTYDWSPPE